MCEALCFCLVELFLNKTDYKVRDGGGCFGAESKA